MLAIDTHIVVWISREMHDKLFSLNKEHIIRYPLQNTNQVHLGTLYLTYLFTML